MPELPDITLYVEALERHVVGETLERAEVFSPSFLRSVDPPLSALVGSRACRATRLGKRIAIGFEEDRWLVLHLMIAGRLRYRSGRGKPGRGARTNHARFQWASGHLTVTEAGTKKRASLYVVGSEDEMRGHDPGGLEPLSMSREEFEAALTAENHTLKRSLTDPRVFSGIGNAYSDEILHEARLSPVKLSQSLDAEAMDRLYAAIPSVLEGFSERMRREVRDGFPEKVTAFRADMAVHGRFGKPCPRCGDPVQRIVYASRETNYCATCQNAGKLLADRALSRLLKKDWPRTLEELEERRGR
ncbi:MAG: formamidopyrimidine-DNA glycosylase [Myxococcales bacterium]|nr:formamidopyrimidine-DNA glycosylase [Myxococcales bacterium]